MPAPTDPTARPPARAEADQSDSFPRPMSLADEVDADQAGIYHVHVRTVDCEAAITIRVSAASYSDAGAQLASIGIERDDIVGVIPPWLVPLEDPPGRVRGRPHFEPTERYPGGEIDLSDALPLRTSPHATALDHAKSALASIERVAARLVARGEPAEEVAGTILRADAAVLRSVIRELGRCAPREPR